MSWSPSWINMSALCCAPTAAIWRCCPCFRLTGQCAGCPAADLTTEELIRGEVTSRVPGVREVALERETSRELLDQARAILRQRHGG